MDAALKKWKSEDLGECVNPTIYRALRLSILDHYLASSCEREHRDAAPFLPEWEESEEHEDRNHENPGIKLGP